MWVNHVVLLFGYPNNERLCRLETSGPIPVAKRVGILPTCTLSFLLLYDAVLFNKFMDILLLYNGVLFNEFADRAIVMHCWRSGAKGETLDMEDLAGVHV